LSWTKLDRIHSFNLPELPEAKTSRFIEQYELKPQEARLLTSEKALADYFEAVARSRRVRQNRQLMDRRRIPALFERFEYRCDGISHSL
jgi:Asp-tRNA(Asn)/Glu-tRNA(Gln) amidotransferase B subunit